MRLAILTLLAATTVQAANLRLPDNPGPSAVAQIRFGDLGLPAIPISIPPDYPLTHNPLYGRGGDNDDAYTVIGAPETGGDGTAFVYDTQTGEYLHELDPIGLLQGGINGPQFGYDVLMHDGLAIVSAPNAGGPAMTQNPGRLYVFDPATGAKLQVIYGPPGYWGFGQDVLDWGIGPYATGVSKTTGAVKYIKLYLLNAPEPGSAWLAALGLLAVRRR